MLLRSRERGSESLRGVPASARIHAALREQILGMEIRPGTALQEKQIALACGVSRTPVREAILKLADERLVDIFPQYGTFVSRVSIPAVRDAMVIRQALERTAVREAAARADADDIARLNATLAAQKAAHDMERLAEFHGEDEAFHQLIAEIAGHPNLWRVVRHEKAQVDRCRILTLPAADRRLSVMAEHAAIIAAIAQGDADAAETAMQAHLGRVVPSVDELALAHPDYFEPTPEASGAPTAPLATDGDRAASPPPATPRPAGRRKTASAKPKATDAKAAESRPADLKTAIPAPAAPPPPSKPRTRKKR